MKNRILSLIPSLVFSFLFALPALAFSSSPTSELAGTGAQRVKWMIGHRADEKDFVQNSLPAFMSALNLGATMAELDVRNTKDNVTVIHHDPNLNDLSECGIFNGKAISELTLPQLKTCHFKQDHTAIPTFEEVLQLTKASPMGLLIELKDGVEANVVQLLADLDPKKECAVPMPSAEILNKTFQCFENTIIYSFGESWVEHARLLVENHPELSRVRFLKLVPPSQNRQLITAQGAHFWNMDGIAFEVNALGSDLEAVSQKMDALYPHQIKLIWSSNGQMDFARMNKLPITGIIASDIRGAIAFQKEWLAH